MHYSEFRDYLNSLVKRLNEFALGSSRDERKRFQLAKEVGQLVGSTFHITDDPAFWGHEIDTFVAPFRVDINHAGEEITGFRFFFSEDDLGHHQLRCIDYVIPGFFHATVQTSTVIEVQVENVEEE